ncbi:cortex morphogenetic protein CmpA [Tumebacillus lipolyticus]|uniref:Cortex morphogenetic protein CmpA n=1 Tax=Tumebacillus lipolyticus TaxID=1280370 RepID=A0ABW4ZW70_9BACL
MPSWLRNQLFRAYRNQDKRSIVMLNRVFYKYRKTLQQNIESVVTEAE